MPKSSATQSQPIYFWRESDSHTGWLSQWYYCPFKDDKNPEVIYETAEHYMMYQKAILFNDHAVAAKILEPGLHPRKIKALGRQVANFSEAMWNANREAIVRRGNQLKFTNAVTEEGFCLGTSGDIPLFRNSLKETLLRTGERELVEASPFDRIWGVGFKPADADANRQRWGLNLLGKALMEVRDMLKEEESKNEVEVK
ncbi:N-glycosidase R617 [Trichoderma asperellum]|uniref:N-glycosidase R617 n=1 Tax=Trichoderma asperellum TaxID=101201 RepID=A0A6V8QTI7_TRIAP|nr:N-glycosidase R617 [Trichoderma asperellum]